MDSPHPELKDQPARSRAAVSGVSAAAALLAGFFLLSRILGFVRQAVITAIFGLGPEADAWFAAFRLPDTIFTLFAGGALVSAVIPVYTEYRQSGNRRGQALFVSGLFNLVAVCMIFTGAAGALLARPITDVLVPGFDEPTRELTAQATRWLMLSPLLLGLSAVAKSVLQAERRFFLAALGPVLYNLGTILGGVFLATRVGILGLVWGTLAGAFFHFAVQLPGLARSGAAYLLFGGLKHPGVRRVIALVIPRLLGFAVVQVSFFFAYFLASLIGPASVSALATAWLLLLFPLGVLAIPFAEASLPAFASLWALRDTRGLGEQYHWALRYVLFLAVPAAAVLAVLSAPITAVLFERQAFDSAATALTAGALVFFAVGLAGHGAVEILARVFYSMQDTKTPVAVGAVSLVIHMLLSWGLSRVLGIGGLALGVSIGVLFEGAALYALVRRRLPAGDYAPAVARSLFKTLIASAVMGAVLYLLVSATWSGGGSSPRNAGLLIGYLAAAATLYLVTSAGLRAEELFVAVRRVRARLGGAGSA